MGGYCRYCDRRCFLIRVLNDGRTFLLATCPAGKEHDLRSTGETHETACNPVTQPRRAARLGILREQRSCTRHGIAGCRGGDCLKLLRTLRLDASRPGEDAPDPVETAAARHPRRTWAGHGKPGVAVFWGFRSADPMDFLSVRPLVGKPCLIEGEEVPKRENGMTVGQRVVVRFLDGTVLRFGTQRRFLLSPVTDPETINNPRPVDYFLATG